MIMLMATASRGISTTARSSCTASPASCGWIPHPAAGWCRPVAASGYLRVRSTPCASPATLPPADLPATCQIVQISPLLRELILTSLTLPESYAPGSRDERVYELILDEIRLMPVLPFHLPEPESEALRHLCQQIRMAPGESWSSAQAAGIVGMSERTLNRHFQQQTGLSYGEWVRRARLLEALVRLAQGQPVLRVALDLGYGSHSAFTAMFRRVMGLSPSDYFRND